MAWECHDGSSWITVRVLAERDVGASVVGVDLAVVAVGVDAQQDGDAMAGAAGGFGDWDAGVDPQQYRGVPQVVGASG